MNVATALPAVLELPLVRLFQPRTAGRPETSTPARGEVHRLQAGATLKLVRPLGWVIECEEGSLWMTHDGDPKDILLEAGQRHVCERPSRMLVHAMGDSVLRLVASDRALSLGWMASKR